MCSFCHLTIVWRALRLQRLCWLLKHIGPFFQKSHYFCRALLQKISVFWGWLQMVPPPRLGDTLKQAYLIWLMEHRRFFINKLVKANGLGVLWHMSSLQPVSRRIRYVHIQVFRCMCIYSWYVWFSLCCNVGLGMSAHPHASLSISFPLLRIVRYVYACMHVHLYMLFDSISR